MSTENQVKEAPKDQAKEAQKEVAKAPTAPAVVAAVEVKEAKTPKWNKQNLIGKRVQKTIEVLVDPLTGQVYEGDVKITEDNVSGWIISQIEHGKARIVD